MYQYSVNLKTVAQEVSTFHSVATRNPGTIQGRVFGKGLKYEILRRSDDRTARSRLPLAISARGDGGKDAPKAYFTGLASGVILSGAVFFSQQVDAAPRGPLLTRNEMSTVKMFKDNTSSVVNITNLAVRQDEFTSELQEVPQGAGSGFIWDDQGHIVTNFHVLLNAADVRVTLSDQSVHQAKFIGGDADKDVAVIQIETDSETPLRPIKVGLSSSLEVGQNVYAIGNPFGLDHTLTTGIISGLNREIPSGNTGRPIYNMIQTDAAINPGNSGGPLLDSNGTLIGINTAIYSAAGTSAGVGFAISSDTVQGIVEQLITYGRIVRPAIGISFAPDASVEQLGVSGVLVLDMPLGSPALEAGMQRTTRDQFGRLVLGDIITKMKDQTVENASDLYRALDRCSVGETIDVEVLRGNAKQILQVTLGDRP